MRVNNQQGIANLCEVAVHLRLTMPENAATKFAIRTVLREAINKSKKNYKGNVNRHNCSYISERARDVFKQDEKAKLIAEHIVPVSLALREFENLSPLTLESAVSLVSKYSTMALITPEEDDQLRALGLVKSMPDDWDGANVFARYDVAGIALKRLVR
ncbi:MULTISPECIES: hypothetical protein [Gammaproteobacteria]|uniref:hypothetical protein n=1 Tax=Gammaproteobacteria TaxID=1236 RepID=UPI000DCF6A52|nr:MULTISPECIES: hypothetical protein [Gammaproteobacteria]RTE87065.1 hypothetical protein DQX04_01355 [Aliidiomarina sp. B3213]